MPRRRMPAARSRPARTLRASATSLASGSRCSHGRRSRVVRLLRGRVSRSTLSGRRAGPAPSFSRAGLLFHLASIAVLLVMWLAARQPGLSEKALRRCSTPSARSRRSALCLHDGAVMPTGWRPEMLFLLIATRCCSTRAALVPARPAGPPSSRRSRKPPAPVLAGIVYAARRPHETSRGASVA